MRNSDHLNALTEARAERDNAMRLLRRIAQTTGKYRERAYQTNMPEVLAIVDDIDDLLSIRWDGGVNDA